ncbi:restriction endonuclease subunit S [Rhizobium sp. FKY42]|uniref:restriction endonuclease subunit S n=1 Tax=Rhizobium sp. FKY42 TaxID=2562310 RepID=UPI0010C0D73F|nr:restriction endonuclease subunit S [Rhizobium sp. FKY42]
MSGLPRGWVEASLGEICHLQNGRAYKQEELLSSGKYPVLRVGNFFTSQKWYYSDLELEPTKYCDDGDLLYAWSASFGPRIWSGGKVIFHYHIWRVDLKRSVSDRDFVFHWFNWDKENIKAAHGTGSTMIHVTKGDMEQRRILLPPLAEQKRIVAKLETLNAKAARARTELARIEALVSRYKQAVLSKAFSGELTSAEVSNWALCTLGDLALDVRYGTAEKCTYAPDLTPVLRIPNVANGRIDLSDLKHASFNEKELRKLELLEGDLLIIRSNGSLDLVGRSAVVDAAAAGMLFAGYLIRVRLALSKAMPSFIQYWMQSFAVRRTIEDAAKSTSGVNNVNSQQLQALQLKLPPLEEQHEIVRCIESAFAKIDRLAKEAKRALELVGRLDEAILAKAFRGELVSQDENDEPAEHLLARIRAEREAAPKGKRGRGATI